MIFYLRYILCTEPFWALLPPILAIVLALITKEAYSSLFIGVLIGAMFCAGFNPPSARSTPH